MIYIQQIQNYRLNQFNYPLFNIFVILLFFSLFFVSFNLSQISLYIQGEGELFFINADFNTEPSEIFVNGQLKSSCKKSCNFENNNYYNNESDYYYSNIILIKFNTLISSCENMFKDIKIIKEIDLSKFDFSNVNNMASMFKGCSNMIKIKFGLDIDTSFVITMNNLFNYCESITSIDISKFKTKNLEDMQDMLSFCNNLLSINLSNFDTSKVTNMRGIFYNCINLRFLDLSNFNGNSVKHIPYVFSECYSLIYLNLYNFKLYQTGIWYVDIFRNLKAGTKICINDAETLNILKQNYENTLKFDCSNICFNKNINIKLDLEQHKCTQTCDHYEYNNYCYRSCPTGTYAIEGEKLCLDSKPIGYYFDSSNYKKCFESCKDCNIQGTKFNNNCIDCKEGYNFLDESNDSKNCYKKCDHYYYFDENFNYFCTNTCPERYSKKIKEKSKCIDLCENDNTYLFKYEYNNYCYKNCPSETYTIENKYICYDNTPEGYYLDLEHNIYKNCFDSCKYCIREGDSTNHNCIECKSGFLFLNETIFITNCYEICINYYYFDENYNYYCNEEKECSGNYNKLILEKNKCVKKCDRDDNKYKFEFKNRCYEKCPEDTTIPEKNNTLIDEYFCRPICSKEIPFEDIPRQECIKNCPIKEYKMKTCILNYFVEEDEERSDNEINEINANTKKEEALDIKLQNFENGFTSPEYDTGDIDNGEDQIFIEDNMQITLTNTQNQKNNSNNNMTYIDLGDCEKMLRKAYNISDKENIYMKKIDVIQEGMKIPKVEYDIYYKPGKNLVKMNLTICENSKVSLLIPAIIISKNLDLLNASSGYYNDICYKVNSESGTDISLKDRKKEFIEKNRTICQEDCDFSEYDEVTKRAKCSCKVKESSSSISSMKINKEKLYKNFIDIKNIANLNLFTCYKQLFSKNGLKKNIASYFIIPIILFHSISIIIFYKIQKNKINDKINDVKFGITYWNLVKADEIKKMKKIQRDKIFKRKTHKNIFLNYLINQYLKNNPPYKFEKEIKIEFKKNDNNTSKQYLNTGNDKIMSKQEVIIKAKTIMAFNDEELNNLPYSLALKFDKRSYFEYYLSLLKTNHSLIFSFFNNRDYNSSIVKMDLFFISFCINYTVNALFFNDDTMHKIYEDEGSFNFIYQLPQIAYSTLISTIFDMVLKLLALSEPNIINFKNNKEKNILDKRTIELKKKLHIKFISYFIVGFIFLLLFWYYLSAFCAIYTNTQIHLFKDTLISFGLSLLYPLLIYLLPGLFRKISLSGFNNKRKCLYNFSQILLII